MSDLVCTKTYVAFVGLVNGEKSFHLMDFPQHNGSFNNTKTPTDEQAADSRQTNDDEKRYFDVSQGLP